MCRNARHQYKWNEVKNISYDRAKKIHCTMKTAKRRQRRKRRQHTMKKEGSAPQKRN
jgi:hypothetical protein